MSPTGVLRPICERPRILVAERFASDAEIDHIVAIAADEAALEAAGIDRLRTYAGLEFEMPTEDDPVLEGLVARIRAAVGLEDDVLTGLLRFRRYVPGEFHKPHLDAYRFEGLSLVVTALLYLADCEGGATFFPKALPTPVSIEPRRGLLAVWFNCLPDGSADERSLHEGRPVTGGSKATVGDFIYRPEGPFEARPRAT
jgi:prolyl 4-hydroxylase